MWLIDENLDVRLHHVLSEFGVKSHTADFANLKGLNNGQLLAAAEKLGYKVILTRDALYALDSGFKRQNQSKLAIVVIKITVPQSKFLEWFRSEYNQSPIQPKSGQVIEWPR